MTNPHAITLTDSEGRLRGMIEKASPRLVEPEVLLPGEYSDREIQNCLNKVLETIAAEPRYIYVADPAPLLLADLYDDMPDLIDGEG